jgi:hypothetical protein
VRLAVERVGREIGIPEIAGVQLQSPDSRAVSLLVYYNEPSRSVDRAAVEKAFGERLGPAIEDEAQRHGRWTSREPLGHVEVAPDHAQRGPSGGSAKSQAEQRVSLGGGPTVRFRLEQGAQQLGGHSAEQQQDILARAAGRAFRGAWPEGTRPQLDARVDGDAAVVRVQLPAQMAGKWPDLHPGPETQARFTNEVYRAGSELRGRGKGASLEVLPTKLRAPDRQTGVDALVRAMAGGGAVRLELGRLASAMPGALRVARVASRVMSSLLPARED